MNEMLKMVNSTEIPNDSIYNTEQDTSAVTTPAPVVQDSHPAAAKKPNKLKVRASDESTVDLAPPPPAKKRSGPRTKVTIADEHEVVDAPTSEQDARVWGNFKMLAHLIEAISCANDEIYGTRAAIENIDTAASTLVSSFIHGPDRNFAEISPASSRAFNAINTGIARQATGCSKWWVQVVCVKSYMCPGLVGMLERFIESDALTRDELASKVCCTQTRQTKSHFLTMQTTQSHVNDQNIATFIVNCSDWSMETREFLFKNHGDVAVADTATKKLMDAKRLRDMIIPKREHEVDIQAVTSAAIASVHAFDTLIDAAIEREHLTVLMALVISRPKAAILNEGWDTTKLFNFFSDVKERNPNDVGWTGECLVDAMKGLLKPSAL